MFDELSERYRLCHSLTTCLLAKQSWSIFSNAAVLAQERSPRTVFSRIDSIQRKYPCQRIHQIRYWLYGFLAGWNCCLRMTKDLITIARTCNAVSYVFMSVVARTKEEMRSFVCSYKHMGQTDRTNTGKNKIKQSRYTPCWRLGGEEV
jgi:hypothetical protein